MVFTERLGIFRFELNIYHRLMSKFTNLYNRLYINSKKNEQYTKFTCKLILLPKRISTK